MWDLLAQEQVVGLSHYATEEEISGVVDALHELTVTTLADEHLAQLAEVVVEAFFERFGGYTPTELLDELALDREDMVADLVRLAPGVVEAIRGSGDLERLLRAELEPFYLSPQVVTLLEGALLDDARPDDA